MLRYVKRNDNPTHFERPEDMPPALHRLLVTRGIGSAEEAERFLHPDARSLTDPFLLNDMAVAAARVRSAIDAGEVICVYGDYDVDGVCASAIMRLWLEEQGADVRVYLPSRHTEGYGLNEGAIREIAGWAKLLLTVDCGVTSVALVALAKALGLDVIVTDHHRPADALPDCPVVNPLLGGYPFPYLCGAGVAWKLVWALSGEMPMDLVDIAALATVADVVSLTGENRALVALGLEAINRAPRPGIAALIEAAGLSGKPVTATTVAFQLAPRLNAGGRLDTALRPLALVTATDPDEARNLAEVLDAENTQRRQVEQRILAAAEAQLEDFDFIRHRAIILSGRDWNPGVIGLAASRLVEKYHYPVVLLSDQGEVMTGSCRSIEDVDIHAALTGCADTLVRFGGHRQAAGLTLESKRLQAFIDAMDEWLCANVPPTAYIPVQLYDDELSFDAVTPGLIAALEGIQPTGFGNPAPVFRARAAVIEARSVGAEGAHLKLTLAQDGHRLGGIAFREGARAAELAPDDPIDVLFVPKLNSYMGRTTAQLEVRAIADGGGRAALASKLDEELQLQCDFLTEILYNRKTDSEGAALAQVDGDALNAWLRDDPQGTLVVTGDMASASRFLDEAPDLFFGTLPDDPRAFNAVCVCPRMGPIPRGYRRVVLSGVPAEWLPPETSACRLADTPGWTRCLPDLDAMREVYRALMALCKRPVRFRNLSQLAHLAGSFAGTEALETALAIAAIEDMGLFKIDLSSDPERLVRLDLRRVEPDTSPVWRAIQRWRRGAL